MGTRSTVHFLENNKVICSNYRQYDGYLSGVGAELGEFLKSRTLVNGLPCGGKTDVLYANGVGCLAAQYIAQIKKGAGNVYMTTSKDRQEYNYFVNVREDDFSYLIKVTCDLGTWDKVRTKKIFEGTLEDFIILCNNKEA